MMNGKIFVGGEWIEGERCYEILNPYDRSLVGKAVDADLNDVEAAVSSAQKGAEIMESTPAYKRSDILLRTSLLIREREEDLAALITRESGKSIKDSKVEVSRGALTFQLASAEATRIEGRTTPMDVVPGAENRIAFYQPFPVGVVAAITPFNFPLNLVAHKVAPAVAAGNSLILKPSPQTPLTAIRLVELLLDAGLPPEGINIITAKGVKTGEAIVSHTGVDMISFTGGLTAGYRIKEISGLKKVCLELGSNSACILEPDTDIDFAVARCVTGAFSYAGQVCISLQRIYIHTNIYDRFTEKFLKAVEKIKVGDPMDPETDYGSLISEKEAERCDEWINEAIDKGAGILHGGAKKGNKIFPTVISDVSREMKVVCKEVFGPVVSLIRYNDFGLALNMVNDSEYGLHAGIFTKNIQKAFLAFRKLKVGGVIVNDVPTYRTDHMPYGGVKNSGIGREGVRFAISEMTEKKIMVFNL